MGLVRLALVSDDRLFCDGVTQILRGDPSLLVTVSSEGAAHVQLDADIWVMDTRTGAALATDVTVDGGARPHVILINAPDDNDWAADALGVGVRGILSRDSSGDDLVKAIHVVHDGGIWAKRRWLVAYVHRATRISKRHLDSRSGPRLDERLSRREREVFRYAATGAGNKELADRLAISEATVKVHLTHIFQKLGVNGRAELAAAYYGLRPVSTPHVVPRSA
jgi:DNA-binding NarL/FixJ family response regulator